MIGWKLDQLMRERQIKGRELAKRMGIGENYLSRVRHEVPDRISLLLLDGLCEGLGCTVADLLEFRPGEAAAPALEAPAPRARRHRTPPARPAATAAPSEHPAIAEVPTATGGPIEHPASAEVETVTAAPIGHPAIATATAAPFLSPFEAAASVPPAPVEVRAATRDLFARLVQEAAPVETEAASPRTAEPLVGSSYLRGGALQAKLDRLKRRRPD